MTSKPVLSNPDEMQSGHVCADANDVSDANSSASANGDAAIPFPDVTYSTEAKIFASAWTVNGIFGRLSSS